MKYDQGWPQGTPHHDNPHCTQSYMFNYMSLSLTGCDLLLGQKLFWIPSVQLRQIHRQEHALSLVVKMSVSAVNFISELRQAFDITREDKSETGKHLHPDSPLRIDSFQTSSSLLFQGWM